MKYQEAEKQVTKYRKLIGKKIGDQKISHLIIVPADGTNEADIISGVHFDIDTTQYLKHHSDFEIAVVFGMDIFDIEGHFTRDYLELFLRKYPNLK